MDSQDQLLEAQAQIWSWALSHIMTMSRKCAIELGIPDAIHKHGRPPPAAAGISLSQLTSILQIPPTKADAFACLMRILSTKSGGLFFSCFQPLPEGGGEEEVDLQPHYSLTPASRLLLRDHPQQQVALVLLQLHPAMKDQWSVLSTWLRRDHDIIVGASQSSTAAAATPFEIANGMSFWDYVSGGGSGGTGGEELKALFHESLASDSKLLAGALLSRCKHVFHGVASLVDVGGGTGTVTAAVAEAFPDMKCAVLDLPHVVGELQGDHIGVEFIAGDMFQNVPSAEAILLKWVIHDWDDERCVKLLKLCREAAASSSSSKGGGKVIIVDIVRGINNKNELSGSYCGDEIEHCLDMLMMALVNGRERDEKQWKKLLVAAGFSSFKIHPVLGVRSLIEAFP
ncbi:unnamed protein product [Linum tenue]|uniref:Uncharacterized protein n=1 Tax=Linum tenue TaxID=586396 RepID=A0AAV0M2E1_9ROSI|nr:unnamed protein product [Linum tenue]